MPHISRRRLATLTALVSAAIVAWAWLAHRQPSIEGRTLGEWCDLGRESEQNGDERSFQMASNAVWQIGERATPSLIRWTTVGEPKWEGFLNEKLGFSSEAWSRWRDMRDARRVRDGQRTDFLVEILGDRLAPALPQLVEAANSRDPNVFGPAIGVIQAIGPGGLAHLAFAITNSAPEYRSIARLILKAWGPEASAAGPMIWPQLDSSDVSEEQEDLLACLVAMKYRPEDVVSILSSKIALYSDDRERCAAYYGYLRQTEQSGVAKFVGGIVSTNSIQREASIEALVVGHRPQYSFKARSEKWGRLKYRVELDSFAREVLAQAGSTSKIGCLEFIEDLLAGEGKSPSRADVISATCFLGELSEDPHQEVATKANAIIERHGPLDHLQGLR